MQCSLQGSAPCLGLLSQISWQGKPSPTHRLPCVHASTNASQLHSPPATWSSNNLMPAPHRSIPGPKAKVLVCKQSQKAKTNISYSTPPSA